MLLFTLFRLCLNIALSIYLHRCARSTSIASVVKELKLGCDSADAVYKERCRQHVCLSGNYIFAVQSVCFILCKMHSHCWTHTFDYKWNICSRFKARFKVSKRDVNSWTINLIKSETRVCRWKRKFDHM